MGAEHAGQHAGHRGAVLEHVGDAARVAQVVLEHAVRAVGVAHEVDAGDEAPGAPRHGDAERLALEAVARRDEAHRDDAVFHRRPLADVEVVEEHVQGGHSLREALLDVRPLLGGDDARHEVHREGPLEPRVLAVDREGDARRPERRVAEPLAPSELIGTERPEPEGELAVVGTHLAALVHELVEEALVLIAPEQRGHDPAR